jgi:23S rRNA (cytosine1962-C5)-methyltransferase
MPDYPRTILHRSKTDALKRFHPWVFSGAIKKEVSEPLQDGDLTDVYSDTGEYLATGFYSTGSIAVKVLTFAPIADLKQVFTDKISRAYHLRQKINLVGNNQTNCYRLINAEGDGMPGLIIDWYAGTAVIQTYSWGMHRQRHLIGQILQQIYGVDLQVIYDKSGVILPVESQFLLGEQSSGLVLENNHQFSVDWVAGQKTGFFLDQRESRALLASYVANQKVLNTFCYSGGFSVYALAAGAELVDSVDSSAKAIAWTTQNLGLNFPTANQRAIVADVFDFLKESPAYTYDVIVLDPPAFAKNLSSRHQAVMAYRRLNELALNKIKPGGVLFTFSCSQVVSPEQFQGGVLAGAIATGRGIQILHHLYQPADHPVSLYHPEGLYLKGLVLEVH